MSKLKIPPLGFKGEKWYGDGLYECQPCEDVTVFVEGALSHHMPYANGKALAVLICRKHEWNWDRRMFYVEDFLEAKIIIQDAINNTSGGNCADIP